ncbi:hypothetical protein Droror1_Dr00021838 [Drosera rotundifolia]
MVGNAAEVDLDMVKQGGFAKHIYFKSDHESSVDYIPEPILRLILLRLPTKYLSGSDQFSSHGNLSSLAQASSPVTTPTTNNTNNTKPPALSPSPKTNNPSPSSPCGERTSPSSTGPVSNSRPPRTPTSGQGGIVGCCGGLVCCLCTSYRIGRQRVFVWNPNNRRCVEVVVEIGYGFNFWAERGSGSGLGLIMSVMIIRSARFNMSS